MCPKAGLSWPALHIKPLFRLYGATMENLESENLESHQPQPQEPRMVFGRCGSLHCNGESSSVRRPSRIMMMVMPCLPVGCWKLPVIFERATAD